MEIVKTLGGGDIGVKNKVNNPTVLQLIIYACVLQIGFTPDTKQWVHMSFVSNGANVENGKSKIQNPTARVDSSAGK